MPSLVKPRVYWVYIPALRAGRWRCSVMPIGGWRIPAVAAFWKEAWDAIALANYKLDLQEKVIPYDRQSHTTR